MRTTRISLISALLLGSVLVGAGRAHAAPPPNDLHAGRVTIGSIPFATTVDTSEATTDALDVELNANCGAPATDASVWYQITPSADGALIADVSASDYSAGVIVATGSPGSFSLVTCAPGAAGWSTTAGTTYTILAFDDQLDGGGNGGTLELTVDEIPPPPSIDITVDPTARFTKQGTAIVSGTVTCDSTAEFAFLETELRQTVGRLIISGFGFSDITCDGTSRPWSVEVEAFNGIFRGGKAASLTFATACGVFDCGVDFEERTVKLSGGKG